MQIERTLMGITALGPGKRMAVWVNGCEKRCRGCISPALQAKNPNNECDVNEYFSQFSYEDCDGVSISGGEPFLQAEELCRLVVFLKNRGIDDILVYTGYTLEELIAKNDGAVNSILEKIAVLIDGPYVESENDDTSNLAGSKNQRIHILNHAFEKRYTEYISDKRDVQVFDFGNYVLAVGIPTREYIRKFNENT